MSGIYHDRQLVILAGISHAIHIDRFYTGGNDLESHAKTRRETGVVNISLQKAQVYKACAFLGRYYAIYDITLPSTVETRHACLEAVPFFGAP